MTFCALSSAKGMDIKMKTCSERNEQRINSLQLSESLEDEIKELDGKNVEAGDVIFTTDTSSFLTIVCC